MNGIDQNRGTGRTTRMLLRAVVAVANGKTVTIVFRNALTRDYAKGILLRAGVAHDDRRVTLVTMDQVERLQGFTWKGERRVFLDHDVRTFETESARWCVINALEVAGVLDQNYHAD